VVAARGGRIFFERYLAGPDAVRGTPLGVVRFGPETLHDMRSVTKSVVGLLYGIALAAGRVPVSESNLLEQFPEYPELTGDPARQLLTIRHALTMTLGTEWDEFTFPYSDPRNSEIAMDRATDRFRYVLERPVVGPPGLRWAYNGGATALLARLIAKGTRQPLQEFARDALFGPLQIARTEWRKGTDGDAIAASGLRMTPRDLARIGVTALAGGRWNGQQVIPSEWLAASFSPAVSMPDGRRYGYHWYLGIVPIDDGAGGIRREEIVNAVGNGGQRLFLVPRLAGIWTRWTSVRKVREGETTNDIFAFLTINPNAEVGAIHPKAMPVILHTPEEMDTWMMAPATEALKLQRPLPDGALRIVAQRMKEDGGANAAKLADRLL
jgi:CubicO group peptidase (beta-lactamase class C family)